MGQSFKQMQGEKLADYHARVRAAQAEERAKLVIPYRTRSRKAKCADNRIADRIDGYDRDDIGESPDY